MKKFIPQFSVAIIAFVALTLLMSYTRPSTEVRKEYIVVFGLGKNEDFVKDVNQKISEGWQLEGGVSAIGNTPMQAMVK